MNQPTREEIEEIKKRLERLETQQTEPIKITRLEIDSGSMREEVKGARADILKIRESQADLRDRLIEHGSHLSSIETKQDAHTEVLGKLVNFAESHDTTLKTVATKDDVSRLEKIMQKILDRLPKPEGE